MIEGILIGAGLLAGLVALVALLTYLMPHKFVRLVVWVWSKIFYRIRVEGLEHIPRTGPVLLISNHISYLDGLFVQLVSPRPVRMVVYAANFQMAWLQWLARQWRAIMMSPNPKAIARALREAREGLQQGDVVGIFPEGSISRTGNLQPFKPGVMRVVGDLPVPIVPVYVAGLWGSVFSFEGGRYFWKIPRHFPYPVEIRFGRPIYGPQRVDELRLAVGLTGAELMNHSRIMMSLPRTALSACKRRKFQSKLADSTGSDLTGGALLMRALILRRLLRRHVLAPDERNVAVLLPPSAPAVLVNFALSLDHRVVINLSYTVTSQVLNDCLHRAEVRHVLTSRKVMEKFDFDLDAEIVYLEDLRQHLTWTDKLSALTAAYVTPAGILARQLGWGQPHFDETLTIIFTSGSTGMPKGAMLSHRNIASNVQAVEQVIHLRPDDVMLGVLPFFHSFGYTITLWTTLSLDIKGVFHFSPLDARPIGQLARKHRATILLATPTFLRTYLRRCPPEDFASLNTVVVGAEKLPGELIEAFDKRFGVRPVEGYGATELAPLVSVNIPRSRQLTDLQNELKEGSVGRPVPGVAAKVVHLETGETLPPGQPGMLWITGPNVMQGYLKDPEKTAEVLRDGWYMTGDVALIDEEGFIHITGRVSRFSKIGGEMVPHGAVEEQLARLIDGQEESGLQVAVTAIPDAKRGERLVVVHTRLEQTPAELVAALRESGLPNIYVPDEASFVEVDELPVLGSGKLDLRRLKDMAMERFSGTVEQSPADQEPSANEPSGR